MGSSIKHKFKISIAKHSKISNFCLLENGKHEKMYAKAMTGPIGLLMDSSCHSLVCPYLYQINQNLTDIRSFW